MKRKLVDHILFIFLMLCLLQSLLSLILRAEFVHQIKRLLNNNVRH